MRFPKKLAGRQLPILVITLILAGLVSFGVIHTVTAANSKQKSQKNCSDTCVGLYEDKASPDTIAVVAGSYVQFNSMDGKTHDLSVGKGGEEHVHTGKFHSGDFSANEGWRVQFNDEGSFFFHDHLNPKVSVLVVVYKPGKQYKIE